MPSYNPPQLLFMPQALGGGPGSVTGSDFGQMPITMMPLLAFQNIGSSLYRVMSGMNMFGGSMNGSQSSGVPHLYQLSEEVYNKNQCPSSLMATSVNPFAGPSMNPNPSDEELFSALQNYLSTQDLTVTKKWVILSFSHIFITF